MNVNKQIFALAMAIFKLNPQQESYFGKHSVIGVAHGPRGQMTLRVYYASRHQATVTIRIIEGTSHPVMDVGLYFILERGSFFKWLRRIAVTSLLQNMLKQIVTEGYELNPDSDDNEYNVERILNQSTKVTYHG